MPIYEFECPTCSTVSEFTLKMSDPYPKDCPKCGKPGLEKLMSRTAFVLQGGGWYNEAYSKKPEAKSSSTTETKPSESKPAETPAPTPVAKADTPKT